MFEQIWIIHLREVIMQSCAMSPSLHGALPEYVISQEDNSPLTLYIDFHNLQFYSDISGPFDQVRS